MKHYYTIKEWAIIQRAYVEENRHIDDVVKILHEAGYTHRTKCAVETKIRRKGLKRTKGKTKVYFKREWSNPELNSYLIQNHSRKTAQELANALNRIFNTDFSRDAIYNRLYILGLKAKPHFRKIKKTPRRHLRKVGERYLKNYGVAGKVWFIKHKKGQRGMPLHRWYWICKYGEIPAKHVVVFSDGNSDNVTKDCSNLELISKSELGLRNWSRRRESKNNLTAK